MGVSGSGLGYIGGCNWMLGVYGGLVLIGDPTRTGMTSLGYW